MSNQVLGDGSDIRTISIAVTSHDHAILMALLDNEMDRIDGLLAEDSPERRTVLRMDSEHYFGELSRLRDALSDQWVSVWHDLFHHEAALVEKVEAMMDESRQRLTSEMQRLTREMNDER